MSDGEEGGLDVAHREKLQPRNLSPPQSNGQLQKQQQTGQIVANLAAKKRKMDRNSLSKKAVTASKAVNIIRRVNLCNLTSTTWDFMQQNLDSVLTYIKDTEKKRKKSKKTQVSISVATTQKEL